MGLTAAVALTANGLRIAQDATSVVAGNIANASTDGYTTKRLTISNIYADSGTVGFKTTVARQFDREVYNQLISSTASTSYLDAQATYVGQINQLMGSTSNGATLPSAIAAFSADLQTLAAQPSNGSAQIQVVNSANSIAQSLNSMAATIGDVAFAVAGDIRDAISEVNALTSEIGKINAEVVSYKAQGRDTSGLEDERDKALLKLSTYIDVRAVEETNGSLRVMTDAGLTMVDGVRATQFTQDAVGTLIIANDGTGVTDVMADGLITSGSLAALYDVKTNLLPQAQSQLDQVAGALAQAMSTIETSGTAVTSGGLSGYSVDLAGMKSGDVTRVSYTDKATGLTKVVDFVAVNDPSSLPLTGVDSSALHQVVGIDFTGSTASVAAQIQTALGSAFTVTNSAGTALDIVGDGTTVDVAGLSTRIAATGTQTGSTALPLFTDGGALYTGSYDNGTQIDGLASRIKVNSELTSNPGLLISYTATTEASDAARPNALLAGLQSSTSWMTLGGGPAASKQTVVQFANSMVSTWGSRKTNADTDLSNQKIIQNNLTSAMKSASAVSTDGELAKLIQLQSAYSANAQVLSTIKDMLNTLLSSV